MHNTARHRPHQPSWNLPGPGSETAPDRPCPAIGAITANLLRVYGHGPAGHDHPSIANWHQFYPP